MPTGIYARKKRPVAERFWEKVDKSGICWEWLAFKESRGYGSFSVNRKSWKAHRFSWLLHYGEIPEGLFVCHHCDNPSCVNPAHLFLGTAKDNAEDSVKKGRWPNLKGENNNYSKLTEKQVLAIRAEYKTGKITKSALARKYNVSLRTIHRIVIRNTWRHI